MTDTGMHGLERAISPTITANGGDINEADNPRVRDHTRAMRATITRTEPTVVVQDVIENIGSMLGDIERAVDFIGTAVDHFTAGASGTHPEFVDRTAEHLISRKLRCAHLQDSRAPTRLSVRSTPARDLIYPKACERFQERQGS